MNVFLNPKPLVRCVASVLAASTMVTAMSLRAIAQYTPPDVGLPGRTEGGGTRGDCSVIGDKSLTAIAPDQNFGYTTDEYPTFYWYMPEAGAEAAEFVLLDSEGNEVYMTTFQLQEAAAGIISLSIPQEAGAAPLIEGENYQWFFSLVCDFQDRSGDIFTSGWIQHVDESTLPELTSRLADAPEADHANIYAQEGIWYTALNKLAEQRFSDLNNEEIEQDWLLLLESIGRENLVGEPFIFEVSEEAAAEEDSETTSDFSL